MIEKFDDFHENRRICEIEWNIVEVILQADLACHAYLFLASVSSIFTLRSYSYNRYSPLLPHTYE